MKKKMCTCVVLALVLFGRWLLLSGVSVSISQLCFTFAVICIVHFRCLSNCVVIQSIRKDYCLGVRHMLSRTSVTSFLFCTRLYV